MAPKKTKSNQAQEAPRTSQLLAALKEPEYSEYQRLLGEAIRTEKRADGAILVYIKDAPTMAVIPPVCKDTRREIDKLHAAHRRLAADFVRTGSQGTSEEMRRVADEIDALEQYHMLVNLPSKTRAQEINAEMSTIVATLKESVMGLDAQLKVHKRLTDLAGLRLVTEGEITHFVATQPVIIGEDKNAVAPAPVRTRVSRKAAPGVAKRASPVEVAKRNQKIKEAVLPKLLGRFPLERLPVQVRTVEECLSKSRTKPFYMSKEQLIKTIEADAELQQYFGKGFRSMTKDQMCQIMFRPPEQKK